MNLGIVFYNKGKKGGAERRYYNLVSALSNREKIYLLANSSLLAHWKNMGWFNENVITQCIEDDFAKRAITHVSNNRFKSTGSQTCEAWHLKQLLPNKVRSFLSICIDFFKLNQKVYKWAKQNNITHINTMQASGILVVFAKIRGCKIIFSYVDYMVQNGYPFHWIQNQGLKTVVRVSDKLDFLSEMISKRMIQKGLSINNSKINIAPTSFTDYSRFYIKLPKKRIIIFSGRFEEIKNPMLALEVAQVLAKRKIDFTLKLIGYGSLEKDMRKFIEQNNLSHCVKIFSSDNIENELADGLIFLSLQKENNYPSQALLEAMASGCIPIVTDVGETRKIINASNGFLVNEDVNMIVDIISIIFKEKNEFEKMSQEIRTSTLKSFNLEAYLNYYKDLIQN